MNKPSQLAIDIVLMLNPADANCYRNPEHYAITVNGAQSAYPAYVCEEVHAKARRVDAMLEFYEAVSLFAVTYTVISDDGSAETKPGLVKVLSRESCIRESVQKWLQEFGLGYEDEDHQSINVDVKHYEPLFSNPTAKPT